MLQSINPASLEIIGSYDFDSDNAVERKLEHAHAAQKEWRERSFEERAIHMQMLAHLLRDNLDRAARMMSLEMGKPLAQSQAEILKCAVCCEYYAHEAAQQLSSQVIESEYHSSRVYFQPLGVLLAIMPWNFPFWQVVRAAVPALMAGNTVVVKPSPEVSGCALMLQELFEAAGMGDGIFTTILASIDQVSKVIAHPRIAAVTFTGSTGAGRSVASQAGKALKKTVLELGGSDAYCVLHDADVEMAARVCASSRLINTGQSCVAAKRFIVAETIYTKFELALSAEFAGYTLGDPLETQSMLGAMARVDLRDALGDQVQRSIASGARIVMDGGALNEGAFFSPMILADVVPGMPAFDEELFGPVAAIIKAGSEQEIIELANASIYGLGAAVFSSDRECAERVALSLEAGCVFVNDFVKSDPRFPFGGVKASGWGRELSAFGIREFVNVKSLVVA